MKNFSDFLKDAMAQANMSQSALSEKSGCSKAAISQYLSGKNTPGPVKMKALADALGVSADSLLESEVPVPQQGAINLADVKITFVKGCRCLRKSEDSVRKLMMDGCDFGKAVQGTGGRLNYIFYPAKLRELVGPERFDSFFGLTV